MSGILDNADKESFIISVLFKLYGHGTIMKWAFNSKFYHANRNVE